MLHPSVPRPPPGIAPAACFAFHALTTPRSTRYAFEHVGGGRPCTRTLYNKSTTPFMSRSLNKEEFGIEPGGRRWADQGWEGSKHNPAKTIASLYLFLSQDPITVPFWSKPRSRTHRSPPRPGGDANSAHTHHSRGCARLLELLQCGDCHLGRHGEGAMTFRNRNRSTKGSTWGCTGM